MGGSGSGGDSFDPAYNARMAELAETQMDWAKEYKNLYQYGVTFDPNAIAGESDGIDQDKARAEGYREINGQWYKKGDDTGNGSKFDLVDISEVPLIQESYTYGEEYNRQNPDAPWQDIPSQMKSEQQQIGSNMALNPYQTELAIDTIKREQFVAPGLAKLISEQTEAERTLLPGQTGLAGEQTQALRDLLPGQTGLAKEDIARERWLRPGEAKLSSEQTESERTMLPQRAALETAQIGEQTSAIDFRKPIAKEFYKQSLAGVDPDKKATQAELDVKHGFKKAGDVWAKNISSFGMDPSSGKYEATTRSSALDMGTGIAGARTQARDTAEQEGYKRLEGALAA